MKITRYAKNQENMISKQKLDRQQKSTPQVTKMMAVKNCLIITNVLIKIQEKIGKMYEKMDNFNKEMEYLKNQIDILKLKDTISKTENA